MKTYTAKPSDITRDWYIVDADGKVLGRLATEIARILRGKHKPIYTPHLDTGDYVVVINAGKVRVTGNNKPEQKMYHRHSGYPGGLRMTNYATMIEENPALVIQEAVKGMIPHNRLGRAMLKKLKIFEGANHYCQNKNLKTLEI